MRLEVRNDRDRIGWVDCPADFAQVGWPLGPFTIQQTPAGFSGSTVFLDVGRIDADAAARALDAYGFSREPCPIQIRSR